VTRHHSPVDRRPFQSKAKLEKQEALVARYGAIAIPELAAAIGVATDEGAPGEGTTEAVAKAA